MMAGASFIIGEEVSAMVRINVSVCLPVLFALPEIEPIIKVAMGGKMTASSNNVVMFPQMQIGASI